MSDKCTERGCDRPRLFGLYTCVQCAKPGEITMLVDNLRARIDFDAEAAYDRRMQEKADFIMRQLLAGQEGLFDD